MLRALALLAVLVCGFAAAPLAATADVNDFSFRSLDVDYTLGRTADGTSTLRVVETFVAEFPEYDQNRGMRRALPETYNGQPLHPELISVTDENGQPRPVETDSDDGFFFITSAARGYVHGAQTYVFTYTMQNVTWRFADTNADEFYWDVNGTGWAQPFGRVTATVHIDPSLADALTGSQACYQGVQGATDRCEITREGTDAAPVFVAEASDLFRYQTMTIAIGFEQGTFALFDNSYTASPWGWVQAISALGLGGAVVFAGVTRARRLRDAPGRPTIIAEYTPPPGIDALQSAVLLGRSAKGIPAEVLEQAVVGSIRIIEGEKRMFGAARLSAELLDPSRADENGRMLLTGLFPTLRIGDVYEFGKQDTRLAKRAQRILSEANRALKTNGLRRKVEPGTRRWPVLIGMLLVAATVTFGIIAMANYVDPVVPMLLVFASVAAAIAIMVLVSRKPLTAKGAEVRDHLLGLKEFIEWAEADRIRMLQSPSGAERVAVDVDDPRQMLKLYEALLPYAVVFGQEKQWADRLAVLYSETGVSSPPWYYGTGAFSASAFSAGIGSLSASASSSSSSGGSSGGGSAGGGGGGGGGGGV